MPSQDDLFVEADFPIYEDLSHGGELKTPNPKSDPYQRSNITGRKSKDFAGTVRMITCVHGTLDETSPLPVLASLIVLDFRLRSPHDSRYEGMDTSLIFSSPDHPNDGTEIPQVIAWAPFEEEPPNATATPIGVTSASGMKLTGIGATGPGGIGGNISGDLGKTSELKYEMLDGKMLEVIPSNVDPECNGCDEISWTMSQGRIIRNGIPSVLRTAVLVKRKSNAKFNAVFQMKLKAGVKYRAQNKMDRLFGRGEIDDPILFDPNRQPQGVLDDIDEKNLKKLVHGESLGGLGFFRNPILVA